jgi:hypothetical protein
MLKLSTKSKLSPAEVIKRAVKYFGPEGYGLKVEEKDNCYAYFEGGGGGVRVSASEQKKGSTVDLESVEWDYQVKEFLQKVK